jgi:hypothetical protein
MQFSDALRSVLIQVRKIVRGTKPIVFLREICTVNGFPKPLPYLDKSFKYHCW